MKHKLLALLLAASVLAMNVMPALAAEVETPAEESAAVSEETGTSAGTAETDGFAILPDGTLTYYYGNATEVVIPDSVTKIGDAFINCDFIVSITIPDGVTSIGTAFAGCSSLKSINIPDGVTSIGHNAFGGCSSLKSIELPDSVKSIGESAFQNCSSLESIEIPDGVTSIEDATFHSCSSLSSITIPDSVKSIGRNVFNDTPWLENRRAENPLVIVNNIVVDGVNCSGNIVIPDGVTYIVGNAFIGSDITSIIIPDGVIGIGPIAFMGCFNLKSAVIPSSVTYIDTDTIGLGGAHAFNECTQLTIYGEEGSYAQEFANEFGIPFQIYTGNMPDDTAQDNTSADAASTSVSASLKDPNGVLPEGVGIAPATRITSGAVYDKAAAAAKAKIKGLSAFAVLDIKLTDASIHELNGYVEVTIPVPGNLTVGDGKTIAIYRLEEDGTTLTRCESSVANGMITFTTNHFSTYIVANVPASPKMGETSNSMNVVYLILLMAGIGSVLVVKRRRI